MERLQARLVSASYCAKETRAARQTRPRRATESWSSEDVHSSANQRVPPAEHKTRSVEAADRAPATQDHRLDEEPHKVGHGCGEAPHDKDLAAPGVPLLGRELCLQHA